MFTAVVYSVFLSAAVGQSFIAMDLPRVVDLDEEYFELSRGLGRFPSDKELTIVEASILKGATIEMEPFPCRGGGDGCGTIKAGNIHQAYVQPLNMPFHEIKECRNRKVSVFSAVGFSEGDIGVGDQLINHGVDFVSITTLEAPKCGVVLSSPYEFVKPDLQPASIKEPDFLRVWNRTLVSIAKKHFLVSHHIGKVDLNASHMESIKRVVSSARYLIEEYFAKPCLPKVRLAALACKSSHVRAVYGRSGQIEKDEIKAIEEMIAPNVGAPKEYFSALVSCGPEKPKMHYM